MRQHGHILLKVTEHAQSAESMTVNDIIEPSPAGKGMVSASAASVAVDSVDILNAGCRSSSAGWLQLTSTLI